MKDKVVLLGKHDMPDVLEYIRNGVIEHSVGFLAYDYGVKITEVLYNLVTKGEKYPDHVKTKIEGITLENVEEYAARKKATEEGIN